LSFADKEALELWEKLRLGYTESQGDPLLREEITGLYKTIAPEEVLVVTPEEGIFIAMNVLLEKGDHVVVTFPGYQSLYEIADALGCEVTRWVPEESDQWEFDIERLRSRLKRNTKLLVINFPHNPTGALIKKEQFEEILEMARQRNIPVFSDEMYRFLEFDEEDRLESASDLYDHGVSLFGLSKSFALAGLRMGWLVTKDKGLLERFAAFKDYTTICSSAPSEILSLIALRAKEKLLKRNLGLIGKNLKTLDSFFHRYSNIFSWIRPKAGTVAFPGLPGSRDVNKFCGDLLDKKGVMLLPAKVFDDRGNHFRIGFGRKDLDEALRRLEEYIEES